ncbi:pantoate-beta-alanine ligase [Cryptococcus wingfieldii CBS 7118]|uniref:Pantoate--beta-alanine ligase n=1 Tax=Cryptococcus wingfieldii CBS 7118 TaxID=1295528 RepID=A0A1E3J6G5_9TREE|nr:pantoate-beta-alanine ligase [Cryptococcus wingfieldii CBS 7118]ODN96448.1 pantoate-beta-alanine ligase [Cryptococcus wingfieldii CBS 7118]
MSAALRRLPGPSRAFASQAPTHIPVIRTLPQLRRWRRAARERGLDVGVVPTMGALHEGHIDLVRTSLSQNPLTVITVFVNPMQFAPTEDFSAYPRQLERDLSTLNSLLPSPGTLDNESPLVVFAPSPDVMYPLKGELQDLDAHKGVEVDVSGWGELMEGASRPQFFKGVATVCTKLFNAVEPDHAYFGQKDIQQALLLKILVNDLLLSHPTPENLHILPTTRSPSGLALSSRNAYLSPSELSAAPILFSALSEGQASYEEAQRAKNNELTGEDIISAATGILLAEQSRLLQASSVSKEAGVETRLDYVELFDRTTFEPVRGPVGDKEMVLAGALWVGKTRLIDNVLLGWKCS